MKQWTSDLAHRWRLYLPPARPSWGELQVYETYITKSKQKYKDFRLLILGSTPEFRDLAIRCDVDYVCADYSKENFIALGQYMHHRDSEKNFFHTTWQEMTFRYEFDMIIGDVPSAVIPFTDHDLFFRNIQRALKKTGICILKVYVRDTNEKKSYKQVFENYRKERSHLPLTSGIILDLMQTGYHFDEEYVDCAEVTAELERELSEGNITQYEFDEVEKRWIKNEHFKLNMPLRTELLEKLHALFSVEVTSGGDWFKDRAPLLVLRYK